MSIVYIVFAKDFDAEHGNGIEGVFATREAAERVAALRADNEGCEYEIGEYLVEA